MVATLQRFHRAAGFAVPLALAVALFFVINVLIPGYANLNSLLSLLLLSSLLGIAAVGQTLTIVIGGFDLSIPAVIGLCNVLFSLLYGAGWPAIAAIVFILTLATLIGLANGFACRYLQLNPLVVTLASGSIIFGAIWAGTHGEVAGSVPDWLVTMVSVIGKTGPDSAAGLRRPLGRRRRSDLVPGAENGSRTMDFCRGRQPARCRARSRSHALRLDERLRD